MVLADWILLGPAAVLGFLTWWVIRPHRSWEGTLKTRYEEEVWGVENSEQAARRRDDANGPLLLHGPPSVRIRTWLAAAGSATVVDEAGIHLDDRRFDWRTLVRLTFLEREGRTQVRAYSRKSVVAFFLDSANVDRATLLELAGRKVALDPARATVRLREPRDMEVFARRGADLPLGRAIRARYALESDLPRPAEAWRPGWCAPPQRGGTHMTGILIREVKLMPDDVWRVVLFDSEIGPVLWLFATGRTEGMAMDDFKGGLSGLKDFIERAELREVDDAEDRGWRPLGARVWERPLEEVHPEDETDQIRWRRQTESLAGSARPDWDPWAEATAESETGVDSRSEVAGAGEAGKPGEPGHDSERGAALTVVTFAATLGSFAWIYDWRFACGLLALVLVHEAGHALAMRAKGLRPGPIVFVPFMGAFIGSRKQPLSVASNAEVALAGPVVGGLGCLVLWVVYRVTGIGFLGPVVFAGLALNLFNLLPVLPLDGGHVVRAISPWLWLLLAPLVAVLVWSLADPLLTLIFGLGALGMIGALWKRVSEGATAYDAVPFSYRLRITAALFLTLAALLVGVVDTAIYIEDVGDADSVPGWAEDE